jgi:streptogramin lyase
MAGSVGQEYLVHKACLVATARSRTSRSPIARVGVVGSVGKLNPKTGEVTEYPMPDPAARHPHTPIFDHQGTLWFTVQGGNMVGRLIPQMGEVKLVTSPTPKSRPYGMVVNS